MSVGPSSKRRLFFALWPDPTTRQSMDEARNILLRDVGRCIPASNLHLTLIFLGDVGEETLNCARRVALQIDNPVFTLTLDKFGSWRAQQVAWIAPSVIPEPLHSLVIALQGAMRVCGVEPEKRDFQPHITVLRDLHKRIIPPQFEPVMWKVTSFYLMESVPRGAQPHGVQYEIVQAWSLSE